MAKIDFLAVDGLLVYVQSRQLMIEELQACFDAVNKSESHVVNGRTEILVLECGEAQTAFVESDTDS